MVTIATLDDIGAERWDAYVKAHSAGSFFHLAGWKQVIEDGAGQDTSYLAALDETGNVVGVLPLSIRDSLLFGKAAISIMFGVYGGPIADSDDALSALNKAAWSVCEGRGIPSLEYRLVSGDDNALPGFSRTGNSATFVKSLADTDEARLTAIPRKQRAVVRKALKSDLTIVTGHQHLDRAYRLYAESVRNLGTPVFPKKLFSKLIEVFGDRVDVALALPKSAPSSGSVHKGEAGQAVASLVSFFYKDQVLPYYAGSRPSARGLGAHDLLYYDLMNRAYERGARVFDFGRSKIDSGPYKFKKNWGFEPRPLGYKVRVRDGDTVPDVSITSPKFQRLIAVWKRLPLPIANMIGPHIARHLG